MSIRKGAGQICGGIGSFADIWHALGTARPHLEVTVNLPGRARPTAHGFSHIPLSDSVTHANEHRHPATKLGHPKTDNTNK